MSDAAVTYATFASQPQAGGTRDLQVKFFLPAEPATNRPLLVWLPAGGFRRSNIEAVGHARMARIMGRNGYACAFIEYRLRTKARDLSPAAQALLPDLIADATAHFPEINPAFIGAAAIAAVEDAAAFLRWVETRKTEYLLSRHYILGGSSAGAMTALNLMSLAPRLELKIPPVPTVIALSGAFAYPSFFTPTPTRVLALHGTHEPQIPVAPIRAYAYRHDANCTLLEDAVHQHGDPRLTRAEPLRRAMRRFIRFDRGEEYTSARTGADTATSLRAVKRRNRICAFTCVKNEGPFLLEWIAHNRAIGVTDFIIFSNDCDDGTSELLNRLHALGIVHHVPNPSMALGSDQHLALAIACAPYTRAFRRSDYIILSDVDEFIQIDTADGTLNGLLAITGYPDVISLSELVFGFDGVETFHDRLVSEQFRACDALDPPAGQARRGVKSIMRASQAMVAAYSNHRPAIHPDKIELIDWLDGAGQAMPRDFIAKGARGLDANGRYRLARLNHYTLRSAESMLIKFQRGDAVRPGRMRPRYFSERNGLSARDNSFDTCLPGLRRELQLLMQDSGLAGLHRLCVAWHRTRIDALKSDPEFAPVWQAIREEAAKPVLTDSVVQVAE